MGKSLTVLSDFWAGLGDVVGEEGGEPSKVEELFFELNVEFFSKVEGEEVFWWFRVLAPEGVSCTRTKSEERSDELV